jgi:chorismate mutase/prephenate dehydratase
MDLSDLRAAIDAIDAELIQLLRRRAEVVKEIGKRKNEAGETVFDAAREEMVLRRASAVDAAPLSTEAVRAIFAEIISACRALEEPVIVAYLGPPYTFTHLAARHRFGSQANYLDCGSVHGVFDAVERGQASVGVVPVENSLSGAVPETLDRLVTTDLKIIGEHYQPIEQCLLGNSSLEEVRKLHTHPQAHAQCQRWLRENLPNVEVINQSSTAAAARAAQADPGSAAIGPAEAADAYGVRVLARAIQDYPDNRTRFFVLGRGVPAPTGRDKTSLVFAAQHRAGALHEALTPFRVYGVNMTMIQSRPVPGRLWQYVFFVDIEGHEKDGHVAKALQDMRELASNLAVLGSYPAAE